MAAKKPRRYTDEERAFFAEYVPGHLAQEIADEFNRRFEPPITVEQVAAYRKNHRLHSGVAMRIEGFSSEEHKRKFMRSSVRFRKNNIPHNAVPLGSERVTKGGYIQVKVAEFATEAQSDNWKFKHHLVYEQTHGAIPDNCTIIFADHNKRNFDPNNIVAVPKDLMAVINAKGFEYCDRESLEVAINMARLTRIRFGASTRPRTCSKCGATFKPRYPDSRKCDSCIKVYGIGRK